MRFAITLIHNKTPKENEAQIEQLKSLVTINEEKINWVSQDEEGNDIQEEGTRTYYTLTDFPLPHELRVYHIIPYQPDNMSDPYRAELPSNLYDVHTGNVQYGKGDEDKIGEHPRFFNWSLKRSTDHGAEASFYLEDVSKFSVDDLAFTITELVDPDTKTEFIEDPSGKFATITLLKEVGQLKEDKPLDLAVADLKQKIDANPKVRAGGGK